MSATINMTFNTDGGVKEVVNFSFAISEMTFLGGSSYEKVIKASDPSYLAIPKFILAKGSGFDSNNKNIVRAQISGNSCEISLNSTDTSFTRVTAPINDVTDYDLTTGDLKLIFVANNPPSTAMLEGFVEIIKFSV